MNALNIIGRYPSILIPLPANQDLTFMPSCSDICKRYPIPTFKICVGLGVFLHIHGYCSVMNVKDTNIVASRIGARNILRGAEFSDKRGRNAAGMVL